MKNQCNEFSVRDEFANFVGKNWPYYKTSWDKIGVDKNTGRAKFNFKSFNFSAFLFSFLFLFYRKRFLEGTLVLILFKIIDSFDGFFSLAILLVVSILLGFFNNALYFIFVDRKIKKINLKYNEDSDLISYHIINQGGTSKIYVAMGIILLLLANILISFVIYKKNFTIEVDAQSCHNLIEENSLSSLSYFMELPWFFNNYFYVEHFENKPLKREIKCYKDEKGEVIIIKDNSDIIEFNFKMHHKVNKNN